MKASLLTLIICAAGAINAAAQGTNLAPVEVRALRATSNSPFAKSELSGDSLRKENLAQDLPYLLQNTPSAVVTSDAGAGVGYTGLRIRGTDGTRINVTLNGVPVNDPESQQTYFVDLPDLAASTSSIQIQRGIGSSTNGAGAFGASVSVASLDNFEQAGATLAATYGSFNTQKYSVHAGTGFSKSGLALDLRLSQISSDGYIDRSASLLQSLQLNAAWRINDKTQLHALMLQGVETTHQAWDGVPSDSLHTNRRYNELGLKSNGDYYNNQIDHYRQNYYQIFGDHRFNPALTAHLGLFLTRGIGYYEEYKAGEELSAYGLPSFITPAHDTFTTSDLIRQLWLDNYHYGAVGSLQYRQGGTLLTLGGGFSQYTAHHYGYVNWAQVGLQNDHYRYYLLDAQKNDGNVYAKAEQTFDRWILTADVQARSIGYFMNGFRKNLNLRPAVSYNFINPKAGATYLLENKSSARQKIYASLAYASHEPNRDDFEASPTALPKPERMLDAEGGYEISRSRWTAGANLYYMSYRDQLVLTGQINDVGAYVRTNVPQSYRAGIELTGSWKPRPWLRFDGNATFSQNKIEHFTEYVDDYDAGGQIAIEHNHTDIAFSPNAQGFLSATFTPVRRLSVALNGRFIGRQYLDNTQDAKRSMADYTLADARIRYTATSKAFREIAFTLALNNILDRRYESNGYTYSYQSGGALSTSNYYYPQAGFNALFGVQLVW